jgi:hypothetical protein
MCCARSNSRVDVERLDKYGASLHSYGRGSIFLELCSALASEEIEDEEDEEGEEGYSSKYATDDSTGIGGFSILGWSVANS